jgi:hypothetical protein
MKDHLTPQRRALLLAALVTLALALAGLIATAPAAAPRITLSDSICVHGGTLAH